MDAADLLFTKPGGMTCTEAMSKGIPMLFYSAIPGQEEENFHYFEELGFGESITSKAIIDQWFHRLLNHYPTLVAKRVQVRNQFKLQAQGSSEVIMRYLQLQTTDNEAPFIEAPIQTSVVQC